MAQDFETKEYLGDKFENPKKVGSITLTQQRLVEIFIELIHLNYTSENVKINYTPAYSNILLYIFRGVIKVV